MVALTQNFPKHERYGLSSQLDNSANSVIANIAEAHGRFYYGDKIRVLYTSRGEIEETQSHLIVSASRGFVSEDKSAALVDRYEKFKMKLNNYISNFWEQKKVQKEL